MPAMPEPRRAARSTDPSPREALIAFAWRHRDEPEGLALLDALTSGRPLDQALGLLPDLARRDALIRRLYATCYQGVSLSAASSVIATDFARYRARAWPHRVARLQLEPREPPSPARFYFTLLAE